MISYDFEYVLRKSSYEKGIKSYYKTYKRHTWITTPEMR